MLAVVKWLHAIREKILGGPPKGPQTTDEQHAADERKADLLRENEEQRGNPPGAPDRFES
jgi:hypothetical protein